MDQILALATTSPENRLSARGLLYAAMISDLNGVIDSGINLGVPREELLAVAEFITNPMNERRSLLHLAALIGDEDICFLLTHSEMRNVPVNGIIGGDTPLMSAVKGSAPVPLLVMLLDKGADVNIPDKFGSTPIHMAVEIGYHPGNYQMAQTLCAHNAIASTRRLNGETPLHQAVRNGNIDIVRLLLDQPGVVDNISWSDNFGTTPLHIASELDLNQIAELLCVRGASVSSLQRNGKTPLHLAVKNGNIKLLKILLWNKTNVADVDQSGMFGTTALHLASDLDLYQIAELLCVHGASVSSVRSNGETPLHIAVKNGNVELLKLLLRHNRNGVNGINVGHPTTPLAVAAGMGSYNCIKCLLDAGAKTSIADASGRMPIEIAAARGHWDCLEILFSVTAPLPGYDNWSMRNIVRYTNTQNPGSNSSLNLLTEDEKIAEEKKIKAIVNFFNLVMDKLPGVLLVVSGMGFIQTYGPAATVKHSDPWFHILSGGSIIGFCSSAILYGYTGYYKDLGDVENSGFKRCTYIILAACIYVLAASSIVFVKFIGCNSKVVSIAAIFTLLPTVLLWPLPSSRRRMIKDWIKELIWKQKAAGG